MSTISEEHVSSFQEDGYLIVRDLFDSDEADILRAAAHADQSFKDNAYDLKDGEGGKAQLVLWNSAGEDLWGSIARSERIVNTMEALLGDEVYFYHSKMSIKQPRTGGAWSWHQDYGYWYNNDCLFPDMASCMIAVDRAYQGNGCLKVLRGSHRLGRIEHGTFGTQVGADPARIALAEKHLDTVYCEMSPGSALFFHANLLHSSGPNESADPRWSLICCYNTRHNPCADKPGHPSYSPLEKWDDDRVLTLGRAQWQSMQAPA